MSKAKHKLIRYGNIFGKLSNWQTYLWSKATGFNKTFTFHIRDFEQLEVDTQMLGPFRENFFDDIYFRHIPTSIFAGKAKPTIIDIGANVGFFSLSALAKFPNAKLYAFEPHPYCFQVLSHYQSAFKKYDWQVFQKAMYAQDTELTITTKTLSEFTTTSSNLLHDKRTESFTVPAIALATFLTQNNVQAVDFMKIDCEGGEYAILYNAPANAFDTIQSMCIETHRGAEQNENNKAMNHYLQKLGYTTKAIDNHNGTGYVWAWR